MTTDPLILTFDLGTTGAKCGLYDSSAREIASVTRTYAVRQPLPGQAEQDPEDWWRAVRDGCAELAASPGVDLSRVAVIGTNSTWGVIPTAWIDSSPGVRYWAMVSFSAASSMS